MRVARRDRKIKHSDVYSSSSAPPPSTRPSLPVPVTRLRGRVDRRLAVVVSSAPARARPRGRRPNRSLLRARCLMPPPRASRRLLIAVLCALSLLIAAQNFVSIAHVDAAQPQSQSPLPPSVLQPSTRSSGGAAPPVPPCSADGLLLHPRESAAPTGERYLVYAPQFGLSNQLVALRNAVAWAQLLNRTLVLPHLLAHGTVHPRAAFGLAFDAASARRALAPLRTIEIDSFLRLGLAPAGVVALATTNRFRAADVNAYFDSLGVPWHKHADGAPNVLSVAMTARSKADGAFSPAAIVRAFGGCGPQHPVLAFQSLFAAFDPRPLGASPAGWHACVPREQAADGRRCAGAGGGACCTPGLPWLDQHALPALLTPSLALEGVAERIVAALTAADAHAPTGRAPPVSYTHLRAHETPEPSRMPSSA